MKDIKIRRSGATYHVRIQGEETRVFMGENYVDATGRMSEREVQNFRKRALAEQERLHPGKIPT